MAITSEARQELVDFTHRVALSSTNGSVAILGAIAQERAISEHVIDLCYAFGIEGLLPERLRRNTRTLLYSLDATAVLTELPNERYWLITHMHPQGVAFTLSIGASSAEGAVEITYEQARKLAKANVLSSSFGIVLAGYCVKQVDYYSNGHVVAICYGHNRQLTLRKATPCKKETTNV